MLNAFRYEVIEGWEQLPAGYVHGNVQGVRVDSNDRVYLLTRRDPRVIVYERDGTFVINRLKIVFQTSLLRSPNGPIFGHSLERRLSDFDFKPFAHRR